MRSRPHESPPRGAAMWRFGIVCMPPPAGIKQLFSHSMVRLTRYQACGYRSASTPPVTGLLTTAHITGDNSKSGTSPMNTQEHNLQP